MAEYRILGKPSPRVDAVNKVTGVAQYAGDVEVEDCLFGKVLLSSVPHARIASINTQAALEVAGVFAVLTGADLPSGRYGRNLKDIPPLAQDRVRFAGERLAAVAAIDEDTAQLALDLIEVEYEELPAVFDPIEALDPGAPLLHPQFSDYAGAWQLDSPSNAYHRSLTEQGDVERGFRDAELVVENTYTTQRQHQGYLEPQSVLVSLHEGRVHVWACSKVPYNLKEALSAATDLPMEQILVHPVTIGGDFGGKGTPSNLPVCYHLAKATERAVRMISDYVEEFMSGDPRHSVSIRLKTGVMLDGRIVAHEVEHVVNCGAYAGYKPRGLIGGASQAAGPYRIENVRIQSSHVYTNTVPGGYMRAPGEPQSAFALESHIDEIARAIGFDPLDFRRLNLVGDGEAAAAGETFEAPRAKETLEAATVAADYLATKPPAVGRGVAIGDRGPGGGEGTADLTLHPDGRVILGTPLFEQGSGTYTVMSQIVAEELGISPDSVELVVWDTDSVGFDSGVAGSRATRVNSQAVFEAIEDARRDLRRIAESYLGWPQEFIVTRGAEVWCTNLEEALTWQELLERSGAEAHGHGHVRDMTRTPFTAFAAQIAEVAVDRDTGQVSLVGLTTAHDVGTIVNPASHQGQINGGVVQGLGYALMEELPVEDGRVTALSFGDYKLPSTRDIPNLKTVLVPSKSGVGPYHIKAIGEPPITPVAAAIANAIHDAVGVRIRELPITSEKVYWAIKQQSSS
jgi:CO/xanthine dehydrogenase Mo-binding subunit